MRLTGLAPRWAGYGSVWNAVTFLCPHCGTQRLGVTFDPPIDPEGWWPRMTRPTYEGMNVWRREGGDTFDTLTLSPSLDFSAPARIDFVGHWHGHITNGEVT